MNKLKVGKLDKKEEETSSIKKEVFLYLYFCVFVFVFVMYLYLWTSSI